MSHYSNVISGKENMEEGALTSVIHYALSNDIPRGNIIHHTYSSSTTYPITMYANAMISEISIQFMILQHLKICNHSSNISMLEKEQTIIHLTRYIANISMLKKK